MTMASNNRDYRFDPDDVNDRNSFEEHNQHMREFRGSHADIIMVNAPRCDEASSLENTGLLKISHTMMETGSSRLLNDTSDWSTFILVLKVARYKLS